MSMNSSHPKPWRQQEFAPTSTWWNSVARNLSTWESDFTPSTLSASTRCCHVLELIGNCPMVKKEIVSGIFFVNQNKILSMFQGTGLLSAIKIIWADIGPVTKVFVIDTCWSCKLITLVILNQSRDVSFYLHCQSSADKLFLKIGCLLHFSGSNICYDLWNMKIHGNKCFCTGSRRGWEVPGASHREQ